jgi:Delta6-protoilludene synthase
LIAELADNNKWLRYWEHAIPVASQESQKRFVNSFDEYLEAVVQQAMDRDESHIRCIESYFELRRNTIGAKPAFVLLELDMSLPEEVIEHPVIQGLSTATVSMICIGNVSA